MDWRNQADYQAAILEDVEVSVRCGLHPWEQHPERPNRLLVSVELYTATVFDAESGHGYLDYDRVRDEILRWPKRGHTPLLETLLADLTDFVFEDPLVDAARISIRKPDIFNETRAAGVEWFQKRQT
ncbi:dihydroneopterin aldolase [Phenylobacterium sp.]|uniref:dihydroneopterin aldolase n=1 Tax=Phenylobacterium sp. TaxID=1871053 RepID=UPI0025CBD1DC|nr:dihydroneopterin aldolase [Phenylobacterium sp.]